MPAAHPKQLLVEGNDDRLVVPYLMEACGVAWPQDKHHAPIWIETRGSRDQLLEQLSFETYAKSPNLEAIGVLVDADADAAATWTRVVGCCGREFPGLPAAVPQEGLVHVRPDGLRFGAWIMPDNRSPGMIESLLVELVKPAESHLLTYAEKPVARRPTAARRSKCPCISTRPGSTRFFPGRTRRDINCTKRSFHTSWTEGRRVPRLS